MSEPSVTGTARRDALAKRWRSVGRHTHRLLCAWREDDKGRHMIYKMLGGVVLALVVLVLVALEVRTTGSYERTFNSSQDKVWRAWNDADSIKHWWGPKGSTVPFIRNGDKQISQHLSEPNRSGFQIR